MYLLHNHSDSPDPSPTTTAPKLLQPFKQQSKIPGCHKGTNPAWQMLLSCTTGTTVRKHSPERNSFKTQQRFKAKEL